MALWVIGGAISAGGSGALLARALRGDNNTQSITRRDDDGDGNDKYESGFTGGMAGSAEGAAEERERIHPAA